MHRWAYLTVCAAMFAALPAASLAGIDDEPDSPFFSVPMISLAADEARPRTTATRPVEAPPPSSQPASQPVDPIEAFIQKTKNPLPWFKFGADMRMREEYMPNVITLNKARPDHEINLARFRGRFWGIFTPVKDMELEARIAWEGRHFDKPHSRDNWSPASVLFDRLSFKWANIGGMPISLKAGRQDLMLGDQWLVMDGTPLDGSSTIYFDAIRLTLDAVPIKTSLDLIFLEMDAEENNWFSPINDQEEYVTEQDETGAIAWLTNRGIPNTELSGYFIYKRSVAALPNGDNGEIYTFGTLVNGSLSDHWKYRTGLAGQFGEKNDANLCALGSNNRLSYLFNDPHNNQLRMDYEYLSGDDPDTGTNEAFDTLWGRWPRFSELYIYTYVAETRISDMTNLHRAAWGWTSTPWKNGEFLLDYHLLFADQNTLAARPGFSDSGCFRGQLVTALLKHKFNEHLSGHLLGEFLFPGDYQDDLRNDVACFLRSEITVSW